MRFYFVRHADKEDGNFLNPRLSQQDQPISKHGRTQAERLCQYFERKAITASYVSEYVRTQQTIRPLARRLKRNLLYQRSEVGSSRLAKKSSAWLRAMRGEYLRYLFWRAAGLLFRQARASMRS